jgi:hypothetical protein
MDDFSISTLHESRNEWCARLVTILTPLLIDGYKSILEESLKMCKANNELEKYLMTFQNLISRIPKWNAAIIETERKRIVERSGCNYLEDLVTCVHVIQMKIMTAMRVGHKQKKIDINIPRIDDFLHKCYVNSARNLYKNVYLFEVGIAPLQIQKNQREMEVIVQESVLNTIRESIPVEAILKAYMDQTVENEIVEEIKEQYIEESVQKKEGEAPKSVQVATSDPDVIEEKKVSFNNVDYVKDDFSNTVREVDNSKTVSKVVDEDDENFKLQIFDAPDSSLENINLEIETIEEPKLPELLKDDLDFEVLEE